jgi:hypothetical protein
MLSEREKRFHELLKQQEKLIKINKNIIQDVFEKDIGSSKYYYDKDEKKYVIRIIFNLDLEEILYSIRGKKMEMEIDRHQLIFDKYLNKIEIIVKILTVLKEINDEIIERKRKLEEEQRKLVELRRELEEKQRKLKERRELEERLEERLEEQQNNFVKNITRDKLTDLIKNHVLIERRIDSEVSYYYEKEVGNLEIRIIYIFDGTIFYSIISKDNYYSAIIDDYFQSFELLDRYSVENINKLIEVFRELNTELDNVKTSKPISPISHTKGTHGGRKAAPPVKKEVCGRLRCIYTIAGSRKEHIKYKGQLITVADYKKRMKKA